MKYKIIFGIILPLLLASTLIVLTTINAGFSVEKDFVNKLTYQDIFIDRENSQLRQTIKIADILIENDYFLGKRYELPPLGVCLNDKEGQLQRLNAGNLQYSEGEYNYETGDFVFSTERALAYPYYYDNYNREEKNIQISAYSKKKIRLFLQPSYDFRYRNYTELLKQYGDYDALLIFEIDNNDPYAYCNNLDQETLDKAIAIPLVKE